MDIFEGNISLPFIIVSVRNKNPKFYMKEDCQHIKVWGWFYYSVLKFPQVTTAIMTEGGRVQLDWFQTKREPDKWWVKVAGVTTRPDDTEWSKPERETPIQYTHAYIWNFERR